jgi:uncharacterized repeat protein (TIGR03803 family)
MTTLNAWKTVSLLLALYAGIAGAAVAQTYQTLATFDGTNGASPNTAPLMQAADGNFYGTAFHGGVGAGGGYEGCPDPWGFGCGTAFRITPQGSLVVIYNFCTQANCVDGVNPNANLILGVDGNLYGTTSRGGISSSCVYGCGTFFRITPAGKFTTLYNFCASYSSCVDGASPNVIIQASDGNFYGTTTSGGIDLGVCASVFAYAPGCGTVFKITPSGKLTTLYRFCGVPNCADGQFPSNGVMEATDGNFYGTTPNGGNDICTDPDGCGTVFKISPSGDLTTLYTFCSQANCTDGDQPSGALIQGPEFLFYGTTLNGGAGTGAGTVFKISRTGALTTLHSFDYFGDGDQPVAGLTVANDKHFYGTTCCGGSGGNSSNGTIFRITPGGTLTTLYSLGAGNSESPGGLLQATNGVFYGTTDVGGTGSCHNQPPYSCGTVFSFSIGLHPFITFVHAAGKVGQTGGILGQGFIGTTSVSLNGTPAPYTVVSDTFLKATVPPGATTGYVTVTTPSGTLTSNLPFQVLP